ncbi:MAG: ATP-binding protein [Candidatus Omnitrophota bacterium]
MLKLRLKLHTKSVIAITLLIVAATSVLLYFYFKQSKAIIHSEFKKRGLILANDLARNCEYGVLANNKEVLNNIVEATLEQPDVIYCIVQNSTGDMLILKGQAELDLDVIKSSIVKEAKILKKIISAESYLVNIGAAEKYYDFEVPIMNTIIDVPKDATSPFDSEHRKVAEENIVGAVHLGLSLNSLNNLMKNARNIILVIILVIIIVSGLITFILMNMAMMPIQRLVDGTKRISQGDFGFKVMVKSNDEIGQLEDAFNKMSLNLDYSRKKDKEKTSILQKRTEELRKSSEELMEFSKTLEQKVKDRTADLMQSQEATLKTKGVLQEAYNELKDVQSQLIQSEKMSALGIMASGVAHEVKNPLGIIIQAANYLEGQLAEDREDIVKVVNMIKEAVNRADGIIRGLLDYSRTSVLLISPENINTIIENSLNLVRHGKDFVKVKVIDERKNDIPKVLVDNNKLLQVFINLFTNASQAMPHEGGNIIIRTFVSKFKADGEKAKKRSKDFFSLNEGVVLAEIEDTGKGISKDILPKIFDPFFSTKNPGQGTGLGLSICASIIDLHKCFLDVESQEGKGTKFTLTLRIAKE